jgi:hypothetical protein
MTAAARLLRLKVEDLSSFPSLTLPEPERRLSSPSEITLQSSLTRRESTEVREPEPERSRVDCDDTIFCSSRTAPSTSCTASDSLGVRLINERAYSRSR